MSYNLKTTGIFGSEALMQKFDHPAIHHAVLADPSAVSSLLGETAITFICRENLKNYKNDDWIKKGTTHHTIIVPYDKVMAMNTDAVTYMCAQLVVERLLLWSKKKQKKTAQARAKAA